MVVSFGVQKVRSFMASHQLVVLSMHVISILFRKSFPVPMSLRIFSTFSSMRFTGMWPYVEVLDQFGVEFCEGL